MVTTDEPPFTLAERARGARAVVVGRIEDRIGTTVSESDPVDVADEMDNDAGRTVRQVVSTYEVTVEDILVGEIDQQRIRLRILGGQADDVETKSTVRVVEGERFAMFLVPDPGRDQDDGTFAPYFDGAYHLENGALDLPDDLRRELRETLDVDEPTLDDLSEFVEQEVRDLKAWDERLVEHEPDEQRQQPQPDIEERPDLETERTGPVDAEPTDRDERRD